MRQSSFSSSLRRVQYSFQNCAFNSCRLSLQKLSFFLLILLCRLAILLVFMEANNITGAQLFQHKKKYMHLPFGKSQILKFQRFKQQKIGCNVYMCVASRAKCLYIHYKLNKQKKAEYIHCFSLIFEKPCECRNQQPRRSIILFCCLFSLAFSRSSIFYFSISLKCGIPEFCSTYV